MRDHGFVLGFCKDPSAPARPIAFRPAGPGGLASSPRFRAFSRPFATTPEAEREQQPVISGEVVLAYAGHVDNRGEIAARLGDATLAGAPDGTALIRAYQAWGDAFPAKVLGEYSFALVDLARGRLVMGRDALGLGHLVWREDASWVWAASDVGLLLEQLDAPPALDRTAIAEYFVFGGNLCSGRRIYEGVRDVPAGHVLAHDGARARETRFWAPDPERRVAFASESEADEALREQLFRGVGAALRSTGHVWTDVSGGLDSSTVTSVAAELRRGGASVDLTAYSIHFTDTHASDESRYQQAVVERHGLRQRTIDADASPLFEGLDETPTAEPEATVFMGERLSAVRALMGERPGVRLTGVGGDQVFCGDQFPPYHLAGMLRSLQLRAWSRELRGWLVQGEHSLLTLLGTFSRGHLEARRNRFTCPPTEWMTPAFRADIESWARDRVEAPRLFTRDAGLEYPYRSISEIAALHGESPFPVQDRHPLLYRPLVELMLALPWEQKLRPDQDRVIQRRATRGLVPDLVRLRTDKGDGTPHFLKGLRKNWQTIRPFARGRQLELLGLVNAEAFALACERMRHGLIGYELPYLVAALALEAWLTFRSRPGRQEPSPAAAEECLV